MNHSTQLFQPNPLIRNGVLQSSLARRLSADVVTRRVVRPLLIDAGEDKTPQANGDRVKLLGYYGPGLSLNGGRGLVLLLHGWEGCSHSTYNLTMGDRLLRAGFEIFQLNLRDHGPNLHVDRYALNRGVFNGTLIDEVAAATHQIAQLAGDKPFYIIGASMGGSFALRLALRHSETPFHNLKQVIGICPAVNPEAAVRAIDKHPLFLRYFRDHWTKSLIAKQKLFPDLYDFRPILSVPTVFDMTDWWAAHYTGFRSAHDYYSHYIIAPDGFRNLNVHTTIVHAANDGVIPVADIQAFEPHPLLDIHIHPNGGHVGFVDFFPFHHHLPDLVMNILDIS